MKKCTKCHIEKDESEFHKQKTGKNGLRADCKECFKKYKIENKDKIKEYLKEYHKKYRVENRDKINKYTKEYREKNRDILNEYQKKWRDKNQEKLKEYRKEWREENIDEIKNYHKKYQIKNREKLNEAAKEWRKKNKNKLNETQKQRLINEPMFRLKRNLSSRTCNAFKVKSWRKDGKTEKLLGATYEVVSNHIKSRFTKGMTWENQGEWHIDHIIPLASATTEKELIELCHYTNLQPLWASDNISKGDKIIASRIKI